MSSFSRRSFSRGAVAMGAILSPAVRTHLAAAQDEAWAGETLQIMAPASPGGGWDTTAREVQRNLQEAGIVSTAEVFNVPGAGGTIGLAELTSKNKGDGHMMMVMGLVMIGAIGLNEAPVGLDQATPIARLTGEYEVIVVPADSPHQSIDDLMTQFKDDPASVSWAGGSAGGTDHLLVGMIAKALEIDPALINYVAFSGGGEALASLLGGETTAGVSGIGEFLPQIEAGELRALALSGRSESSATPAAGGATPAADDAQIPTLQESGIEVELANWRGIVAPPELADGDKQNMIDAITAMHDSDVWAQTLVDFAWDDLFLAGDDFASFISEETDRVNSILDELGLLG